MMLLISCFFTRLKDTKNPSSFSYLFLSMPGVPHLVPKDFPLWVLDVEGHFALPQEACRGCPNSEQRHNEAGCSQSIHPAPNGRGDILNLLLPALASGWLYTGVCARWEYVPHCSPASLAAGKSTQLCQALLSLCLQSSGCTGQKGWSKQESFPLELYKWVDWNVLWIYADQGDLFRSRRGKNKKSSRKMGKGFWKKCKCFLFGCFQSNLRWYFM